MTRLAALGGCILLGLSSVTGFAAEGAGAESWPDRWVASTRVSRPTGSGHVESQVFSRVWVATDEAGTPASLVGMAELSYLSMPRPSGERFDADRLAGQLLRSMGLRAWHRRAVGPAFAFEADWPAAQRFIKVFVRERGDTVSYSVALVRGAYAGTAYGEAELLQRHLAGVDELRSAWLERLLGGGVASAWAYEGCSDKCGTNVDCWTKLAACQKDKLIQAGKDKLKEVGGLDKVQSTANDLAEKIRLTQRLQDVATRGVDSVVGGASGLVQNAVGAAQGVLKGEASSLLTGGLSAITSVIGAVVPGGGLIQGVANGLFAAGEKIFETLTQARGKSNDEMVAAYTKARREWEDFKKKEETLEKAIEENMVFFKKLSTQFGMNPEELIEKVGQENRAAEKLLEAKRDELAEQLKTDSAECHAEHQGQFAEVEALLAHAREVSGFLTPSTLLKTCDNLAFAYRQLVELENMLQGVRGVVGSAKTDVVKKKGEVDKQDMKNFTLAKDPKALEETRAAGKANADERYKFSEAQVSPYLKEWRGKCWAKVKDDNSVCRVFLLGWADYDDKDCRKLLNQFCSDAIFLKTPRGREYSAKIEAAKKLKREEYGRVDANVDAIKKRGQNYSPEMAAEDQAALLAWMDDLDAEQSALGFRVKALRKKSDQIGAVCRKKPS